jgi:hypothetical protein
MFGHLGELMQKWTSFIIPGAFCALFALAYSAHLLQSLARRSADRSPKASDLTMER